MSSPKHFRHIVTFDQVYIGPLESFHFVVVSNDLVSMKKKMVCFEKLHKNSRCF